MIKSFPIGLIEFEIWQHCVLTFPLFLTNPFVILYTCIVSGLGCHAGSYIAVYVLDLPTENTNKRLASVVNSVCCFPSSVVSTFLWRMSIKLSFIIPSLSFTYYLLFFDISYIIYVQYKLFYLIIERLPHQQRLEVLLSKSIFICHYWEKITLNSWTILFSWSTHY